MCLYVGCMHVFAHLTCIYVTSNARECDGVCVPLVGVRDYPAGIRLIGFGVKFGKLS